MDPRSVGPLYCETPLAAFSFPAEPVNFFSNAVIVLFGLAAMYLTHTKKSSADVWALALLLVATGVGSFLWHGYRTGWALTVDVVPGLLFLLLFVYVWARRVWSVRGALAFLVSFFGASMLLSYLTQLLVPFRGPPLGIVVAVIGAASYLIQSVKGRGVTALAIVTIGCALVAFFFHTIDLYTCTVVPFGTHFLWHFFLSAAAFLGILVIQKLDQKKIPS